MLVLAMMLAQANPYAKYKQPAPITVFGVGNYSCAKAHSAQNKSAAFVWVMGYFSGRNYSESSQVGGSTDGEGIMGEVKLLCDANPTDVLVNAASSVFNKLKLQKR